MKTALMDAPPPRKPLGPGEIKLDWIPEDWALTPLNGKRAYVSGWTSTSYTLNQIKEELESGRATGVGLLTGQHCNEFGLLWVDFDGQEGIDAIEVLGGGPISSIFPPTLTVSSGKKGRMRMLFRIPGNRVEELPDKATLKLNGIPSFEILWRSRQGALMGMHPDTDGYRTTEHGGFEHVKSLPELPDWFYKAISNSYPSSKYRRRNGAAGISRDLYMAKSINLSYEEGSTFQLEYSIDEARTYLSHIPAEQADDYEEWIAVGMALHQVDDSLLADWIEWSEQSDSFEDGCCEEKWKSFERLPGGPSPEGARGIRTLLAKAKENGYIDMHGYVVPNAEVLARTLGEEARQAAFEDMNEYEGGGEDFEDEDVVVGINGYLNGLVGDRGGGKKKSARNPPASEIADLLMPLFVQNGWRYDPQFDAFLQYEKDRGIWRRQQNSRGFKHEVQFTLSNVNLPNGYSSSLLADVSSLLEGHLAHENWEDDVSLLAFRNGVLEVETGEFLEHSKDNFITWGLDFEYDPTSQGGPIIEWIKKTQYGDEGRVQVLRAWLRACLVGRGNELQRFLEVVGPGGRGKSTFSTLCCALVGYGNFASTNLQQLEQGRFELSAIKDRRLTIVNDAERYGGSVQNLKALTGGDPLRYEEKLKPIGEPFVYTGVLMIVANEPIQTTDNTSGLARRRLTVEFDRKLYDSASDAKEMIKIRGGKIGGEWAPYLSGLVNWLLEMSDKDMRRYLLDTSELVPSLSKVRNQILIGSNNIVEWLQSECVEDKNNVVCVGKKLLNMNKEIQRRYHLSDTHLYPSYCEHCDATGSKPVGQRRFINLLLDVCKQQLGLKDIITFTKGGKSFIKGLGIRLSDSCYKNSPTILSETNSD